MKMSAVIDLMILINHDDYDLGFKTLSMSLSCRGPNFVSNRVSFFLSLPTDTQQHDQISCENNVYLWHCKHIKLIEQ